MKQIYEIRYKDVRKFRPRHKKVKASSINKVREYYNEYLSGSNIIDDIVLLDENGNDVKYF